MKVIPNEPLASLALAAQVRFSLLLGGRKADNGFSPVAVGHKRSFRFGGGVRRLASYGCGIVLVGLAMTFCATLASGQGAPDGGVPDYYDTDGDELTGSDDACPERSGPEANRGCPWTTEVVVVVGVNGATAINCSVVPANRYCRSYSALLSRFGSWAPIFIDRNVYYGDGQGGDGGCDNIALNFSEQQECKDTLMKLRLDALTSVVAEVERLSIQ